MGEKASIEILIKLVPYFKSEASEAFNFIQNCQSAIDLATDDQKKILLPLIKSKISGNASTILMNKSISSWDDLKKELNILFKEKYSNLQLHRELISLKQNPGENVVQFAQRCETLQRRMLQNEKTSTKDEDWNGKNDYIKSNILSAFINGLHEKIMCYCNAKSPKLLSEASAFAIEEESRLKIFEMNKPHSSNKLNKDYSNKRLVDVHFIQIKCYNCGKIGHKSFNCKTGNSSGRKPIKCYSCGKMGHTSNKCFRKNENNKNKTETETVNEITESVDKMNFRLED